MSFRFFRRMKIAPGLTLNLSKSGLSASFGPRGAKATLGPRGVRTTAGIPGTGMYYTKHHSYGKSGAKGSGRRGTPVPAPEERLTLGFLQRLSVPREEQALLEGLKRLIRDDEPGALTQFRQATALPDGAFLAGFLALKEGHIEEAASLLGELARTQPRLGTVLEKYGVVLSLSLAITGHIQADLRLDRQSVLLGLVECHQLRRDWAAALACLQELRRLAPEDPVVLLSLCELVDEVYGDQRDAAQRVVRWTAKVSNDSEVHTALLLYKVRALRRLEMFDAARQTATVALRRKRGREEDLLMALRYERGLVYDALGQRARARRDFEEVYARQPDYEAVAMHLGQ